MNKIPRIARHCLAGALLMSAIEAHANIIIFGEDLYSRTVPPPGSANSDAARDIFAGLFGSYQTETFDNAGSVNFGSLANFVVNLEGVTTDSQIYNWALNSSSGFIANLNVSANGFGFYANGWGNESSHALVTVTLADGTSTLYNVPHTVDPQGGGAHLSSAVFFWGLFDPIHTITSVQVEADGKFWDSWSVDNVITGTRDHVPETLPAAYSSAALLGLLATSRFISDRRARRHS